MYIIIEEAAMQDISSIANLIRDELGYTNLDFNKFTISEKWI